MKRKDNIFTQTQVTNIDSSKFDFSHERRMTFNMGEMIPSRIVECIPGDNWDLDDVTFLRLAPMVSPVMHKVRCKKETFFVPNRIIFPNWEDFITGIPETPIEWPYIYLGDGLIDVIPEGSLADYLGIPPGDYSAAPVKISAIPFAAFYKIYDDWYRDQNLVPERHVDLIPGDNTTVFATGLNSITDPPPNCAWEHDYFTSALPFPQQGTSDVELPLVNQQNIPVEFLAASSPGLPGVFVDPVTGGALDSGFQVENAAGPVPFATSAHVNGDPAAYDPRGSLVVDIQGEAASINDLREAWSLQSFLERSIRSGLRYFEQLWGHFKVKSPDARLQRPEMIYRSVANVVISEVLSTAQSNNDATSAEITVGDMAGHGISADQAGGRYYCEEHGFILTIMRVLPDTAYMDGIHRMFFKEDRLAYPWPSFAHLGEQEILGKELFAHDLSGPAYLESVFGYVPRYSEYRFMNSQVAGQFRSSLAFWTMARQFSELSPPELNDEFVTADPRFDIFAVSDMTVDHIYGYVINADHVVRKLPRYGIPSELK